MEDTYSFQLQLSHLLRYWGELIRRYRCATGICRSYRVSPKGSALKMPRAGTKGISDRVS